MRDRSEAWKSIVANGEFEMETVVRIYGATGPDTESVSGADAIGAYKEYNRITSPVITRNLLAGDALSVGNCTIGTLTFSVLTVDTIPKSARIVVRSRPFSGEEFAEWMDFGTFWIDERTAVDGDTVEINGESYIEKIITINAFDSMKMGNQVYNDNEIARIWPKTIKTVVTRIAYQMDIAIDSRTMTQVVNSSIGALNVVLKPEDTDSLLDILARIGGVIGGNWTITDNNELRCVFATTIPFNTNYIIDNSEDYNYISTENGDAIIWTDNDDSSGDDTENDIVNVNIVLGAYDTAREYSISRVTMSIDDEHVYSYGDNTGFELLIENNPYATPGLCKSLYDAVVGIVYAPYNIENACYDPAAEIGDGVSISSYEPIASILFNETRTFDVTFRANASAPGEDETESEYPYKNALTRMQYELENKTIQLDRELRSVISQTQMEIMQMVSDKYTTKEDTDIIQLNTSSLFSQRADSISLSVEKNFTRYNETLEIKQDIKSEISQTADRILLSVSERYTEKSETAEVQRNLESAIDQTAGQILLSVSENYTEKSETAGIDGRLHTAESQISLLPGQFDLKVSKDGVVASINASPESITINAEKVNLSGYVSFSRIGTAGETFIDGGNIKANTITLTKLDSATSGKINDAASDTQYIYISKVNGTTSVAQNTTWVTNTTGNQNTWTTKRPVYNSTYPVLFVAKQTQSEAQRTTGQGTTCSCTTPVIDQTTTIIDGGRIITGSVTANQLAANTITGDKIAANTITVGKLTGNISNSGWGIDFTNGTFSIGEISADKITSGTINADRIGGISVDKIDGSIISSGWGIDFTNGTFSIGTISADQITSGTIDTVSISVGGRNVQRDTYIDISGDTILLGFGSYKYGYIKFGSDYQNLLTRFLHIINDNTNGGIELMGKEIHIKADGMAVYRYNDYNRYAAFDGYINYSTPGGDPKTLHFINGIAVTT